MQRRLLRQRRSELEEIKESGMVLDFDEIARKGAMSAEEKQIAKFYGVYASRQKGDHMIRVVVPGGKITAAEARAMGRLADRYSPGLISVTTRQSLQYHKVRIGDLPSLLRGLAEAGKTTWHGCGDVARNVVACQWASICPHRRLDVMPLAEKTAAEISADHRLDNLPRKFKVNFSGCSAGCGQPWINCVGAIGIRRRGADGADEAGFRVVLGGGMGWDPHVARPLFGFVRPQTMVDVVRAAGLLFRDHGDRWNRATGRLKKVVARQGIDFCRDRILEHMRGEGADLAGLVVEDVPDAGPDIPPRPLREPEAIGTDGQGVQQVKIPKGELTAAAMVRMADLSERYADKHLYTTNRQNIELHGVRPDTAKALRDEIAALGLEVGDFYGLTDVVTCVGTTYCPLAVSETRGLFDLLQPLLREDRYAPIRDRAVVNITGCPNSCSPYYIADIGFRGMRIRGLMGQGSDEAYQVRVGGTQTSFGRVLGEYKTADCIRVTRAILNAFLEVGEGGESLADNVERLGIDPYVEAVAQLGIGYAVAPNPTEYSVPAGAARGELDRKTIAKDVPCQEACPAKTNVPEYIRMIAEGKPDQAHRINQEDNVFPGVLGRVCTRPCEPACRHTWTNIHGPVRICHLKRAAADDERSVSQALAPWFDPSGKRVAIVGGGPAGLTAARELRRYGHDVTVFERESELGGIMWVGIPIFRLPRDVLRADVKAITDSGIDVRLGEQVASDTVRRWVDEKQYDAVLVAAGAHRPRELELDGLDEGQAIEGLEFMKRYNLGEPLEVQGPVVVVGGGFTAVDCARSAKRLLGPDGAVSILYRRGVAQMTAGAEELHEIREEGIAIDTLVSPVAARVEGGSLAGLTFRRNTLAEPEPGQAKPRMIPVEGSDFDVPCRTLICAIGQVRTHGVLPDGVKDEGRRTSREGLFVAGDFALGAEAVIDAVADGKAVAADIDAYLTGRARRKPFLRIEPAEETGRLRDHDLLPPPTMPVLPAGQRGGNEEVELGLGPQDADTNAWRCYLCGYKYEIDQDKCIHCDWCIKVSPRNCILRLASLETDEHGAPLSWRESPASDASLATYIWINSDECIRCGNCIRACPTGAISLRKADLDCETA